MNINNNNFSQFPELPLSNIKETKKFIENLNKAESLAQNLSSPDIEKLSLLRHPPKNTFPFSNLNLSVHELYDFGAKNTKFEGSSYSQTLNRFTMVIDHLPKESLSPAILDTIPLFADCAKVADEIDKIRISPKSAYSETMDALGDNLAQKVQALPVGKKMLLPGGWIAEPSGHAILYVLERVSNRKYKLTVCNTGEGLIFHKNAIDPNSQMRFQTFLTISNISKDKFSSEFLRSLLEPSILPSFLKTTTYNESSFYCHFIKYLDGKVEKSLDTKKFGMLFAKPQRSGTCAMKSIFATIRYLSLSPAISNPKEINKLLDEYKRFRFAYRKHSLIETCLYFFNEKTIWNRNYHKVISEVSTHFSRAALKLKEKHLINDEELIAVEATVADIREKLIEKKNKFKTSENSGYKIEFNPEMGSDGVITSPAITVSIQIPHLKLLNSTSQPLETILKNIPKAPEKITPENVSGYLREWVKLDFFQFKDESIAFHNHLINALRSLPIPKSAKDSFWNNVSPEEIEICLEGLTKLSLYCLSNFSEERNFAPAAFIEMQTAYAIGEVLSRRQAENQLDGYTLPYHHILRFAQSPATLLNDPEDQYRLDQIINYFAPDVDLRLDLDVEKLVSRPQNDLFAVVEKGSFDKYDYQYFEFDNIEIKKKTINKIIEFKYYKKFLNSPKIKEALKENNLDHSSIDKQIAFVASHVGLGNPLLPKGVLFLKNLAIGAQVADPTKESKSNPNIGKSIDPEYNDPERTFNEFILSKSKSWDNKKEKYSLNYASIKNSKDIKLKHLGFSNGENPSFPSSQKDNLKSRSQNKIITESYSEIERDKNIIRTNAHDEIVRYLAFLENQPEDFLNDETDQHSSKIWRTSNITLLTFQLFRSGRLLRTITDEPLMATKIMGLLNRRLDYFMMGEKWKTALMLIDICNRCSEYIKFAENLTPGKYPVSSLRNYREILLNSIIPKIENRPIKMSGMEILAGFSALNRNFENTDRVFVEKAIDLISTKIMRGLSYGHTLPLENLTGSFLDTNKMKESNLLNNLFINLNNSKNKDLLDHIFNSIVYRVTGKKVNHQWSKSKNLDPNLFHGGDYSIDILNGTLNEANIVSTSLSPEFLNSNWTKTIFSQIRDVKKSTDGTYLIFDNHGKTTISKENVLSREIDGILYYLTPLPASELNTNTTLFADGHTVWFSKDANPPHFIVEDIHMNRFYVDVTILNNDAIKKVKIDRISDTKDRKNIILNPRKSTIFDAISNLEHNYEKIVFWAKNSAPTKIDQVDLPDLQLNFYTGTDTNNKPVLYSREETGFFIAEDQMKQYKNKWPAYLVLENPHGDRKVIMRKFANSKFSKTDFDPKLSYEYINDKAVFTVKMELGKAKLIATSNNDAFFLVLMHLSLKRFNQASEYLNQCQTLFAYTENTKTTIKDFIKETSNKAHPSALTIMLRLAIMIEENQLKYNFKKSTIYPSEIKYGEEIVKIYESYLNNIPNIKNPLSIEDEKTLLRLLGKINKISKKSDIFSPQIIHRLETILKNEHQVHLEENFSMPTGGFILLNEMKFDDTSLQMLFLDGTNKKEMPIAFTSKPNDFRLKFRNYYLMALNGTEKEREHLKKGMRILAPLLLEDHLDLFGCFLLIAVCENPKNSPQLETIIKTRTGTNKEILNKLNKMWKSTTSYKELIVDSFLGKLWYGKEIIKEIGVNTVLSSLVKTLTLPMSISQLNDEKPILKQRNSQSSCMLLPQNLENLDAKWQQALVDLKDKYQHSKDTNATDVKIYLDSIIKQSSDLLLLQKKIIINMVNEFRGDISVEEALRHQGRKEKSKLTFDDAILLFEKGNALKYKNKTSLSGVQIMELEKQVADHILAVTRLAQFKRILALIKEKESSDEKEVLNDKILAEFNTQRQYPMNDQEPLLKRLYLVFEYRNEIMLRSKQQVSLEYINSLKNSIDLLLELGTGSGKSKVLAPMMERLRNACGKIVFNIWPSPLYQVNKTDMQKTVEFSFGQRSDTFEYSRDTSLEDEKLLFYLREFAAAIVNGRQINSSPESLQACELKFLELLHKGAHKNGGYPQNSLTLLKEILNFVYASESHIDEGHVNLSPRREVNFTVGDPITESPSNVKLIEKIFRFISTDKITNEILGIREDRQRFVKPETYKDIIAPRIAEHFVTDLSIDKSYLRSFLDYVQGIKTDISWLKNHPKKELIILLREHIHFLLPEILQKSVNVNYGLSHRLDDNKMVEFAKPYSGNDSPIENAEYDNIYETFDKTYLTYLYQGLKIKQTWNLIQFLQTESLKEAALKKTDPHETKVYQFFKANFPKELGELSTISYKDLLPFEQELKNQDNLIFYYIENLIAPTIKKFEFKLKSSSANFRGMFGSSLSMTATPGNKEIYSDSITLRKDDGSEKKVIETIVRKCQDPKTLNILNNSTPIKILKELTNKFVPGSNFRMLIDIGALLKGISNITVAQFILEHFKMNDPKIKGVVFFDKDERMMILEIGKTEPIPIEQTSLLPSERFTYCDQRHSFGADIPQFHSAKGLATMDKLSDKDAVVQGVGRLRQFSDNGQTVEWAMTKEVASLLNAKGHPTIKDLLSFAQENQDKREKEDLRRAIRQQMAQEIRSVVMKKLLNASDSDAMIELFKDFEKILVEKVEELSGDQLELELTTDNLKRYCNQLQKKLMELNLLTTEEKTKITQRLKAHEKRIDLLKPLLPVLISSRPTDLETEVEIQQNVEMNTETNIQQQTIDGNDLYYREPLSWPKKFSFYDKNWLNPSSIKVSRFANVFGFFNPKNLEKMIESAARKYAVWINTPSSSKTQKALKILSITAIVLVILGLSLGALSGLLAVVVAIAAIGPLFFPGVIGTTMSIVISIGEGALWIAGTIKLFTRLTSSPREKKPEAIPITKRGNEAMKIYRANDVVKSHFNKKISNGSSLFEPDNSGQILMTNNFITLKPKGIFEFNVTPLSKEQKTAYEVLVIQDQISKTTKQWTIIMGDQSTDAMFWREELERDINTSKDKNDNKNLSNRKVCLYDLTLGLVKNGKNGFNEKDELQTDPDFQKLIAKVKLYNGDYNLTPDQQVALALDQNDSNKIMATSEFFQHALAYRPEKAKGFATSWLAKFFTNASNGSLE